MEKPYACLCCNNNACDRPNELCKYCNRVAIYLAKSMEKEKTDAYQRGFADGRKMALSPKEMEKKRHEGWCQALRVIKNILKDEEVLRHYVTPFSTGGGLASKGGFSAGGGLASKGGANSGGEHTHSRVETSATGRLGKDKVLSLARYYKEHGSAASSQHIRDPSSEDTNDESNYRDGFNCEIRDWLDEIDGL